VASYLLVANETAESQELLHAVSEIHAEDPGAEFVIVVPATPLNLLQQFEGTAKSARGLAAQRAQSTRQKLESLGIRIRSTRVGNWDPYVAIEEELLHENMRQSWYQRCRLDCHVGFEWTYRPGSSVATQVSGSSMWLLDLRRAAPHRSRRTKTLDGLAARANETGGLIGNRV